MTAISTLWRTLESNYGLPLFARIFYLSWKMSSWKDDVENRLSGVECLVERYTKNTNEIYTVTIGCFSRPMGQTTNPAMLTEYDAELSDKINAKKILDTRPRESVKMYR